MEWLKKYWLITLIAIIIVGFVGIEAYSMNSRLSAQSDMMESKISEIKDLQTHIDALETDLETLNGELSQVRGEMERTTALFWTKFNKIKVESQNQTPEQVLEGWKESWPGGTK